MVRKGLKRPVAYVPPPQPAKRAKTAPKRIRSKSKQCIEVKNEPQPSDNEESLAQEDAEEEDANEDEKDESEHDDDEDGEEGEEEEAEVDDEEGSEDTRDKCLECFHPMNFTDLRYKREKKHKHCGQTAALMLRALNKKDKKLGDQLKKMKAKDPKEYVKMLNKFEKRRSKTTGKLIAATSCIQELTEMMESLERVKTMRRSEDALLLTQAEYVDDRMRRIGVNPMTGGMSKKKWIAKFDKIIRSKSVYCEKNADKQWTVSVAQPTKLSNIDDVVAKKKMEGKDGTVINAANMKSISSSLGPIKGLKFDSKTLKSALKLDDASDDSDDESQCDSKLDDASDDSSSDDRGDTPSVRKRPTRNRGTC
jgi:hypothetical protein